LFAFFSQGQCYFFTHKTSSISQANTNAASVASGSATFIFTTDFFYSGDQNVQVNMRESGVCFDVSLELCLVPQYQQIISSFPAFLLKKFMIKTGSIN